MRLKYVGIAWLIVMLAAAGCGPGGGEADAGGDAAGDVGPERDTADPDTTADTGVEDADDADDAIEDTAADTDDGGEDAEDTAVEPAIAFRDLADGDAVNGTVTVAADIIGTDAVESVEFLIGMETIETANRAPWEFEWATNLYDEETHELELVATLEGGSTMNVVIDVRVDRTAPNIEINEPTSDTLYIDQVPIKADVSDNYEIDKVVFKVDANTAEETLTAPPWETTVDLSDVEDGLHTVGATAHDSAGLKTKDNVSFTLGCKSDDHCDGEKLCVEDKCQTLSPQCSKVGESCNPDSRQPAGEDFACTDAGFGAECRATCTVTADATDSSCGSGSICLGADVGNEGYCVESQCTGLTDTSSCNNVQDNDLFTGFTNGAKCRAIGNGTNLCMPAGAQGVGETCNAVAPVVGLFCEQNQRCEACGTGLSCVNGTCNTICQGDAACSSDPEGSVCIGESNGGILGSGIGFCDEQCEAFSRGQCSGSNEGCVPLNNSVGYCHGHGSKGYMAECQLPDDANPNRRDCDEGLECTRLQSENSVTGQVDIARCLPRCEPPSGGGTGTDANDVTCRGDAHARFVHLASSSTEVDMYVQDDRLVDDLARGSVSDADPSTSAIDFHELTAAEMEVDAVDGGATNNSNPLTSQTSTVTSAEAVTWAGTQAPAILEVPVPREMTVPASGKATVRVVNTLSSGRSIDVEMATAGAGDLSNSTTLAAGRSQGAASFQEIDAGDYDIYVFDASDANTIGNEIDKFTGVTIASKAMASYYIHVPASGNTSDLEWVEVPYRTPPDAVARTCWASSENPAPASGICLQGCDIDDYGNSHCAGTSNGCAPFGREHFCLPRGDKNPGETCSPKIQSAYSDCSEGAFCEERGDGSGECASYCVGGSSSNSTLTCSSSRTCTAGTGSVGRCQLSCSPDSDFKDTSTCPSNLQTCLPATQSGSGYSGAYCSASGSNATGSQCGEGRPEGTTILQNCDAGEYCAYGDGTDESLLAGMFQQRTGSTPTCRESCEPFGGGSSCPSGQSCEIDLVYAGATAAGICQDDATIAVSAQTGSTCGQSDVGKMCGDHSVCIPNQGQYICLEFCRWQNDSDCTGRTTCQRPQNGLIAGEIGFCLP